MTRILHLDSGREMRGGQWQVLRLMRGLRAKGFETPLRCRAASPLFATAKAEGFDVGPLGWFSFPPCDLIHAHDARAHTIAAFRRAPLVVSRRVAFPIGSKWKYARAARFIAVSEYVAGVLETGGVPREKIAVVYDGVPLLAPAAGDRILIPATDDPRKGQALATAAAKLAGVPFTLSRNLEADLATARMLVYMTHSEGLGSGVLLAMSAGVPVIASEIGGIPEAIRHRDNGLLVTNSREPIAEAVAELDRDPVFARQIGRNARLTIETRFSEAQMVQKTIGVYRGVLNG